MSSILDITASSEIEMLRAELESRAMQGFGLTEVESRIVIAKLRLIGSLVHSIEREVCAYRLIDAGKAGAAVVEQLATDALVNLSDGKIVRPEFGRKA